MSSGAGGVADSYKYQAWKREGEAEQLKQKPREEDFVDVKCRCKSCGKKFSTKISAKWKSVEMQNLNPEEEESEMGLICPKCKSTEIEVLKIRRDFLTWKELSQVS